MSSSGPGRPRPRLRRRWVGSRRAGGVVGAGIGVPHVHAHVVDRRPRRPGGTHRRVVPRRRHPRRGSGRPSSSATGAGPSTHSTSPTAPPCRDGPPMTAASPSTRRRRCRARAGSTPCTSGPATPRSPARAGTRPTRRRGSSCGTPPSSTPPATTRPRRGSRLRWPSPTCRAPTSVVAGSLDQEQYALNASNGATLPGWPLFTSDSVFSTAAVARPLRHGVRRHRRGRRPDRGVRGRPSLPPRRPSPHRQPGRRRHLRLPEHPDRRLLAGGGRVPPRWGHGHRRRHRRVLPRRLGHRRWCGPSTPTATRCGPRPSTAPPRAAPRSPTSSGTGRCRWWRGPTPAREARSGSSTGPRASPCGSSPSWVGSSGRWWWPT